MIISGDPRKSAKTETDRGLPFSAAAEFDWEGAIYRQDNRHEYLEVAGRFVAVGYLGIRLHVICFTPIVGGVHVISFRKANPREVKHYEKEVADK